MVCGRKAKLMFLSFSHVPCDTHSMLLKPGSWVPFVPLHLDQSCSRHQGPRRLPSPLRSRHPPGHLLMPWPSNLDISTSDDDSSLSSLPWDDDSSLSSLLCLLRTRITECEKPAGMRETRPECEKPSGMREAVGLCSPLGSSTTV